MTTDEAQHEITRIVRQLHKDTGSLVIQIGVSWNVEQGGFGRRKGAKLVKLEFTTGFMAEEATG